MNLTPTLTEAEEESIKQTLAEDWDRHEEDYRDNVNYEGSEIVYEDDEMVIVADRSRSLLNNLLRGHELPTNAVIRRMADIAEEKTDQDWSDSTAVVFPRER